MSAIVLKFHTIETGEAFRQVAAEAFDAETGNLVTCLPLRAMHEWLRDNGYRWREGSSGIWERAA